MATRNPYIRLLRANPEFRRLYLAQLISFGGDWFLVVPLLGLVYELTGSEVLTTAVLVAENLPAFVMAPVAGAIADRMNRKVVMVTADIIRAVVVLGILVVDDLRSPALAFVLLALVSVGSAFFFPASNGALPNLVSDEQLAPANVLLGSAWGTMAAVGAALGGAVAALVGRDAAFAVDAASFLVSAWLILRIRRPFAAPRPAARPSFLASIRGAVTYAREHPAIAALLTSKSGFGLIAGVVSLFPLISIELFDAGDQGTGLLFGARGLGALVGPFLVKRWFGTTDRRLVGTIGYAMAAWGICYVLLSQAPTLALAGLAVTIAHMGGGTQWTMSTYGLQRLTADDMRGRIFSFDFGLVTLGLSISFLIAGALANAFGVEAVVAASGAIGVAFGLAWAQLTRRFWAALDPPRVPPAS